MWAVEQPNQTDWEQMIIAAQRLQFQGNFAGAERIFWRAIREAEIIKPTPRLLPVMYNNLGSLCHEAARFADAETYFRKAIRLCMGAGDTCESIRVTAMLNLGTSYLELRQITKAKRIIREAEEEPGFERNVPERPGRLHKLAMLSYELGEYGKAAALCGRVIRMSEPASGAGDATLAVPMNLLSMSLVKLGQRGEALSVVSRMVALLGVQESLPPLYRARILSSGADLLLLLNRPSEAEAPAKLAVEIADQILEPQHPLLAAILSTHAHVLRRLHRNLEAKELEERARRIASAARDSSLSPHVVDIHELGQPR
jgi:tetratricopeptide (TPR) repeat protein